MMSDIGKTEPDVCLNWCPMQEDYQYIQVYINALFSMYRRAEALRWCSSWSEDAVVAAIVEIQLSLELNAVLVWRQYKRDISTSVGKHPSIAITTAHPHVPILDLFFWDVRVLLKELSEQGWPKEQAQGRWRRLAARTNGVLARKRFLKILCTKSFSFQAGRRRLRFLPCHISWRQGRQIYPRFRVLSCDWSICSRLQPSDVVAQVKVGDCIDASVFYRCNIIGACCLFLCTCNGWKHAFSAPRIQACTEWMRWRRWRQQLTVGAKIEVLIPKHPSYPCFPSSIMMVSAKKNY